MARLARHWPWLLVVPALALGSLIASIDSSPGWDDTGITVGLIFLGASAFGFLAPRLAWLTGLLVGGLTPLIEIPAGHGTGSLAALLVAVLASYAGAGLRLIVRRQQPPADAHPGRGA